ncbi:Uncharacterised protein [Mycobacteroides abscessus subsp. massiliense]|nr:Uncharacterised protein [Mycobacteroides abscessus subsp. massiliense]
MHPDEVVRNAEHSPQLGDFVHRHQALLERRNRGQVFGHQICVDDHLEVAAQRRRIHQCGIARNDTLGFQPAHPPQARGRSKANPVRQFLVRQPPMILKLIDYCAI